MSVTKPPVFISWSGKRSRAAAIALREWLPKVLSDLAPWMSEMDIPPGSRWSDQISNSLSGARFGILCLTPENLSSPWLLFEAGVLAKQLPEADVCPVLFDMEPSQLTGPLALFQALKANREDMWKLVCKLNQILSVPRQASELLNTFNGGWPEIENKFGALPSEEGDHQAPRRSDSELLAEILETVRAITRRDRVSQRELSDWLDFIHREALRIGISLSSIQPVYSRMPPPPDEPHFVRVKDKADKEYIVRLDVSASPGTIMKSIRADLKQEFSSQNQSGGSAID